MLGTPSSETPSNASDCSLLHSSLPDREGGRSLPLVGWDIGWWMRDPRVYVFLILRKRRRRRKEGKRKRGWGNIICYGHQQILPDQMLLINHSGNSWSMIVCARLLLSVLRGCAADISSFILERYEMWGFRQLNIRWRVTSSQPSTVLMNLSVSLRVCPVTKYDVSTFFTMPGIQVGLALMSFFLRWQVI